MKSEAIFNHKGEPTITVYPETEEEKSILSTMLGKAKGEDGNHDPTTFRHRI